MDPSPGDGAEDYEAVAAEGLSASRILRAGYWAFGLRGALRVISLVRLVVLARLLAPEDFGQMGIALLALSVFTTFTETGMSAALVQQEEGIEDHLDTAWTVQILRKAGVSALLIAFAPLATAFFDEPAATPIVRGVAVGFFLTAFQNIGIVYYERNLEFGKRFVFGFAMVVTDAAVAIVLASVLGSAWALVWGFIAASIVGIGLSYALHPYRPRLRIKPGSLRLMYRFGRWMSGLRVLSFVNFEVDDIVVGRMLGTTSLGLYQMSYRLTNLPATEVIETLSEVLFPSYARLQTEPGRAKRAFLLSLNAASFIALPLIAGVAVLAEPFVLFVLGDAWEPTIPVMRWLAAFVALDILARSIDTLFAGLGRPDVPTKFRLLQAAVFLTLVIPLTDRFGMVGTAISVVIAMAAGLMLGTFRLVGILDVRPSSVLQAMRVPLLSTGLMAGVLLVLAELVVTNVVTLALVVVVGASVYLVAAYLLGKVLGGGPQQLMAAVRSARS